MTTGSDFNVNVSQRTSFYFDTVGRVGWGGVGGQLLFFENYQTPNRGERTWDALVFYINKIGMNVFVDLFYLKQSTWEEPHW